ncbi:hypothetical protein LXL04_004356 [Taraxacum kok-saghyz]
MRGADNTNVVMNKCLDKERHALLHFKTHFQDLDGCLSTWATEEDECCKWFGVTCDNKTGHVTRLEISMCAILGEISDSLLNLSYLTHLELSFTYFHGMFPRFIGSLTKLRLLKLAGNSLYGTIPAEFGNLTNLETLVLQDVGWCRVDNLEWLSHLSQLEELVMDGISLAKVNNWVDVVLSLRKLSFLSLNGCDLSQVMYPYSSFSNSSLSIHTLYLENNHLNSSMYHWLFPLTSNKLSDLDLSSNMLDEIPKYLGNLCSMKTLYFDNNSVVFKFTGLLHNLSGCTSLSLQEFSASGSQLTGSLSDEIGNFQFLKHLDLSKNKLKGTISEKLWQLPKLTFLSLYSNHIRGSISLKGVPSIVHISNISHVLYFDMSSCMLGPRFPKWIQTLKTLNLLDISDNRISESIPLEFWDMWPSQLKYLNLSLNNITGLVPDLSSNFDAFSVIDLSSNNFYGSVPNVSSTLQSLNLSRNKFSGGISFLCQIVDGLLEFLDLSHNFLSGQLPDCLWHFKGLKVLNLGHNNLFGRLPNSIGSLISLEAMYLYNNTFSEGLPLTLKNCTSLKSLNLGANQFSGKVPIWIGENLSQLYALILGSNNFFGTIPLQLCQLAYLQILDLSMNSLHGSIPSCLNNLTSMVQEGWFNLQQNIHYIQTDWTTPIDGYQYSIDYVDNAMIEWQGDKREFFSNLIFLKTIDLSNNNLTGEIPHELTNLNELILLNLSQNTLHGEIPQKVGQMEKLLALDLSRNNLSGCIPSSMSQMSLLNDLDVSFNNLSGRIPSSTQLQSFEPARYVGNAELCGPPLTKACPGDEESKVPSGIGESGGRREDIDEFDMWFYIGGFTGFATGFWIACGALILNRHGRHAFSVFLDSFYDWVYVKFAVLITNRK